jgi:hypothetical protein
MPLYDFECRHGHRFEHQCKIAQRKEEIPCEGEVNQVVEEEVYMQYESSEGGLPSDLFWTTLNEEQLDGDVSAESRILMRKAPCQIKASLIATGANLHHNWGANREDALADRYDPLYPNTRSIGGGKDLNRK